MIDETAEEIIEDTSFKLICALFYLLMVTFVIPLPGDRGKWLNYHWPLQQETSITITEAKETPQLPETTVETIDEKEAYVKAIRKVYGRTIDKGLMDYMYVQARTYGVDPKLVIGIMAAESSFDRNARSHVGAVGLMQVWPKWHQDRIRGRNILDSRVNIQVGVDYLSWCLKHRGELYAALSCYNGSDSKESADRYYMRVTGRLHEIKITALEVAGI